MFTLVQTREDWDDNAGVRFSPPPEDDGYVSPDFGLPESDADEPPVKKPKVGKTQGAKSLRVDSLQDEEEMALQLLGRG
jgi:ATP-dependent RNA helicase DDX10/DBP4